MHELIELRRKRDTYLQTAQNVVNKAIGESRGLTADEQKDVSGLKEKAEAIRATIQQAEELSGLTSASTRSIVQPVRGLPAAAGTTENRVFNTLGEQLRSVIQAGSPGGQIDPKLYEVRAISGMSETVPSDGGFMLEPTFSYELLQTGMAAAKIAPRCRPFPVGVNSNNLELPQIDERSRKDGYRFGGIALHWAAEGSDLTPSRPKFRKLNLVLKKLTGLCYLTEELLADVAVLQAYVAASFTSEFAFVIDNTCLRGTGAGEPLGILNSPALVTVSKETNQQAKTILYANVLKMFSRLPAASNGTACWFLNQDTWPQLYTMNLPVGTGGAPVFLPGGGANGQPYSTLMGLPIVPIEQASTLGTVGDIVLADWGRYLLASKGGLQVASSIHVRFVQDEQVLRFVYRIDGQPDLATSIVPAQGSDAVSPFIVLETRA